MLLSFSFISHQFSLFRCFIFAFIQFLVLTRKIFPKKTPTYSTIFAEIRKHSIFPGYPGCWRLVNRSTDSFAFKFIYKSNPYTRKLLRKKRIVYKKIFFVKKIRARVSEPIHNRMRIFFLFESRQLLNGESFGFVCFFLSSFLRSYRKSTFV